MGNHQALVSGKKEDTGVVRFDRSGRAFGLCYSRDHFPGGAPRPELVPGSVYARDDLRAMFGIIDSTINTGVFQPRGSGEVWLFVTEKKTPDRTQYLDHLKDDVLLWQGQTMMRTDPLIIDHVARGLRLLVFYRKEKYQFPRAAFKLEGEFCYVSHSGSRPTSFILCRRSAVLAGEQTGLTHVLDPAAFPPEPPSSIVADRPRVTAAQDDVSSPVPVECPRVFSIMRVGGHTVEFTLPIDPEPHERRALELLARHGRMTERQLAHSLNSRRVGGMMEAFLLRLAAKGWHAVDKEAETEEGRLFVFRPERIG